MILKGKKILITGGAGFIGAHAVEAFLKKKAKVRVLDNFMSSQKANLEEVLSRIELIEGDIRDPKAVSQAMRGIDVVLHLAAIRSVTDSVERPHLTHEVNASGTLLLLDEAAKAKIKHFLFASTSAVYGSALAKKQKEGGGLRPISPYGVAKLAGENYADYYYNQWGLPTTAFRIFNVYGPRQNPESRYSLAIPGILSKILKNQPPLIDGDGRQMRDFVYVSDVVGAFMKALGNKKAYGQRYNLGSGQATSINQLAKILLKLTGSRIKPMYGPKRPGDPRRTCADIVKAKRDFNWFARVNLTQGLGKVVEWYQS